REGAVFVTQCEPSLESVKAGLRLAREHSMYTIFNVAPIPREPIAELLPLADVLVVNETEASALAGGLAVESSADAQVAAERLLGLGPAGGRPPLRAAGGPGGAGALAGRGGGGWCHHRGRGGA